MICNVGIKSESIFLRKSQKPEKKGFLSKMSKLGHGGAASCLSQPEKKGFG